MTNNVTRGGKGKSQESAGTLPGALKSLLCVKTPPTACAVLSVCVREMILIFAKTVMKHTIISSFKHTELGRFFRSRAREVPLKSPHYHFLLTSTLSDAN